MKAYQKGDSEAFTQLYERYNVRLHQFFARRLSSKHQNFVEDLFQTTWLKLHLARKSFDPQRKLKPWLYQIAINSMRDHLELRRFKEEITADQIENIATIESDIDAKIDFDKINIALEKIPSTYREILLLSDSEGFTSAEISEITHISAASVRQILSRTRKNIRDILGEKV